MALQIINRRGYLHEWNQAEAASPPTGNLRRGEIAIAIVTSDGTDTGDIVEVIGRIGPSDTPTPFSDCPVVFRSPRGFKGADVRPVLVDGEPAVDSVLAYDNGAGKFVSLSEDPGTYEEDDDDDDGNTLSEVSPSILVLSATGLTGSQTAGSRADYTLSMEVVGRPDPILSIEIIERDYPDATNGFNYTESTAYTFTTDNLPQNVTVTTSTDSSVLSALGATNYTISGLAVLRAAAVAKVGVAVRVSASNTAGVSPVTEFAAGSIAIVADQTGVTPEPRLTKVAISEGGSETSKIANLATDASVTLTANYVAADFTDGVDNGSVAYQWLANGAELAGETGSSVTLTNTADGLNDSQVHVVVTITNDNGTDTRSAFIAIGDYDEGFTELTPSADSRLIYVAANGDDAAAATAKGRGYYLPGDPEIGPDPTNPVGPITAYATHFEAAKRVRLSKASGEDANGFPLYAHAHATTGYPDWVLLRRGDSFLDDPVLTHPNSGNEETYDLGALLGGNKQTVIGWDQSRNRLFYYCGPWRGRSASEPAVVTAWGSASDPRPVLSRFTFCGGTRHTRLVSVELQGAVAWGWGNTTDHTAGDVLIEDIRTKSIGGINGAAGPYYEYDRGLVIRRNVVHGSFNPDGHNQGFFLVNGQHIVTIEENIFDKNGFKEDPNEPTTWTWNIGSTNQLPAGQGVQPKRSYYDRNMYLSSYADLKVRGNVIARGGGGSDLQMRVGGVCERNLFLFASQACGNGHPQATKTYWHDFLFRHNVMLHDDMFLPPGGFGSGLGADGQNSNVVIDDNIAAHFHRYTNSGGYFSSFSMSPKTNTSYDGPGALLFGVMTNNVVDHRYGADGTRFFAYYDTSDPAHVAALNVGGNQFSVREEYDTNPNPTGHLLYFDYRDTPPSSIDWGDATGNLYHSDRTNVFSGGDFATHQAKGYDSSSTFETNFATFQASAGWSDPDRDIVSYMQSVDPTYVVNEDVYVDDGATGQKQAVRQKVWEVLYGGSSDPAREAWAKLTARRYHAFLAFIEKARANRKGAWDSRWTADAVSNYIREGYGKAAVGGPYTTTLDDIATYGAP